MIEAPAALTRLVAPWSHFYGHSTATSTIIVFLHVAALVVGGGLAIALDRDTLRSQAGDAAARAAHLHRLGAAHRVVLSSLAVAALSGVALFAADLETYFGSWVFWLKMALLVLLLANGGLMARTEAGLRAGTGDAERAWRILRPVARASIVLWLALTLAGVALTNP